MKHCAKVGVDSLVDHSYVFGVIDNVERRDDMYTLQNVKKKMMKRCAKVGVDSLR